MRRLLFLSASLLLLTACTKTVSYTMTFDLPDPALQQQLTDATLRVIENRLLGQEKKLLKSDVTTEDGKTVLTLTVSDAQAAKLLTQSLTIPFTMSVMKQVDPGMGDISNEKFGDFKETSIVTEHFQSVAAKETEGGKGGAVIMFTPRGQELLQDLFEKNPGATIGIFVRGVLMSKKVIDSSDPPNVINVDGIPTPGIAKVFADDVNVGLHVRFSESQ